MKKVLFLLFMVTPLLLVSQKKSGVLDTTLWVKTANNLTPVSTDQTKVSIGTSSQYDENTVLTIKDNSYSNTNGVVIVDSLDNEVFVFNAGAQRFGIGKIPQYTLDVLGLGSFSASPLDYTFFNGGTVEVVKPTAVVKFQSVVTDPFKEISLSYNGDNGNFIFLPRTVPNGIDGRYIFQNLAGTYPLTIDMANRSIGVGLLGPTESIETDRNILLSGSASGDAAGRLIFYERGRAATKRISFRSQETSVDTDYSLPQGGTSTYGKVLQNNTDDSLSWVTVLSSVTAEDVTVTDTESVFDSTTVEGALEELDEMSRNKFFYIANTAALPLAKGNTTVILDGALTPFTVTFTTTNLRVGDEVKVSCFNGSVTLDSSSGGFIRPTVGTNEATIPIDAAGYILVWDGTNFYKVN